MKKQYFNYNKLLEDYLNRPLREKIRTFSLDYNKNINILDSLRQSEYEKMKDLMCSDQYIDERLLNESYLFGIIDNKVKIVQYSKKYLMDDLLIIDDFLKRYPFTDFNKKLRKIYWIDEKHKSKYLKKAEKKNLECLYDNDNIGANILNYINEKEKYNILGDRYGVQNHILDNLELENPDFMKSKLIIIMNFDCEIIELYQSIPYELLQKGTANLEADSIYGCYFNDFNSQKFIDEIGNR